MVREAANVTCREFLLVTDQTLGLEKLGQICPQCHLVTNPGTDSSTSQCHEEEEKRTTTTTRAWANCRQMVVVPRRVLQLHSLYFQLTSPQQHRNCGFDFSSFIYVELRVASHLSLECSKGEGWR